MNTLFFWKTWPSTQRFIYQGLLSVFLIASLFFVVSYFQGNEAVIDWETVSLTESHPTLVDKFNLGLFNFSYEADNYLIIDSFRGSNIKINYVAAYLFLALLTLGIVTALTVFTYLRGFWFYLGILLFIGLLATWHFEHLFLFGKGNDTALIIAMVLFMIPYYYFNNIRPKTKWVIRFFTFILSAVIFSIVVWLFAETENPFLILANYGITAPLILSILFIFMIAHEIVAAFLQIITQNTTFSSTNSLLHFSILTLIYLGNVLLAYLHNTEVIDWDIIYVSAFLLLPISIVLGIWGFKQRENVYDNLLSFRPQAAYLYLALAIICCSTIAYFFATGNDPVVETFEDAIIYSHFGYGLIFFLYVLVNFADLLLANQQAYKVVYKPSRFPYATSRIAGFIVVLAFFLESNMFPFYQAVAGYYNGIGDINLANQELFAAEQYYKLGNQYESQNHRSNYSLASLAQKQGDEGLTVYYLQQALLKKPTPFAYVNLSNAYQRNGRFFDALFTLREGLNTFPDNENIKLNLGLVYGKTNVLDSALLLLDQARESSTIKSSAEADLLALSARHVQTFGMSADSVFREFFSQHSYMPSRVNALGLLNQQIPSKDLPDGFDSLSIPADTVLTSFQFSYLYNYLFHQREKADTALLQQVETLIHHTDNYGYSEPLTLGLALTLYEDIRLIEAFFALDRLQAGNPFKNGYYNHVLGLWALELHAPQLASRFFQLAEEAGYPHAGVNHAIALTEASGLPYGNVQEAKNAWEWVNTLDTLNSTAQTMLKLLRYQDFNHIEKEDDIFKYQLLRICGGKLPMFTINTILYNITDVNYKAAALLDMSVKYPYLDSVLWDTHKISPANDALLPGILTRLQWRKLEQHAFRNELQDVAQLLPTLVPHTPRQKSIARYCEAILAAYENKPSEAETHFRRLFDNPFYPEGVVKAAEYFTNHGGDDFTIYNKLLKAMEVNPYSATLHKHYILQCLKIGLDNYAADAYQALHELVPEEEYERFSITYQQKLQENSFF